MCDFKLMTMSEVSPKLLEFNRIQEITAYYNEQFNESISYYVKVPGRVNLIGEHVDYCGYPVLPMALEQSILMAVGLPDVADTKLKLRNMDKENYPDYDCDLSEISLESIKDIDIEREWYRYFLCAYKGTTDILPNSRVLLGLRVVVSGNFPTAAGLASSSALVSAAVLATSYAHHMSLECHGLAQLSANCERYIGTEGGGMDQAIAFLASENSAQFIEFYPQLLNTPVTLPTEACFVLANSLVKKNKAASSDFNERVVECRLASKLLAKSCDQENWRNITRLIQLQKELSIDLRQMELLIKEHIKEKTYTRDALLEIFKVTTEEFKKNFLTENTQHMTKFKLNQRALHVVQESIRVLEFKEVCAAGKSLVIDEAFGLEADNTIDIMSKLMRASHHSLQTLYECSHPQLDRIIALSDHVGVGARVTGAGWGGFIVALCKNKVHALKYIDILKKEYYNKLTIQPKNLTNVVFLTKASGGAELVFPKYLSDSDEN